jgi:DNA-binding transcriptional LysR family regulator
MKPNYDEWEECLLSIRYVDLRVASHVTTLARTLSFTRAASELGITQSALSRSIQQLERLCGVKLFDRGRTGIELTAMGRIVHEHAVGLLAKGDELDHAIDRMAQGCQGRVAFGMARTAAVSLLPQMLASELTTNPDLQSQVVVRSFDELLNLLQGGEIEFFVGADQKIPSKIPVEANLVALFPLAQLVRRDHPLLGVEGNLRYRDYPWMVASNTAQRTNVESRRWHHLRPAPQIILEDLNCAALLTQTTDVIWVTSAFSAISHLQDGRLCELPFPAEAETHTYQPYELMLYKLSGRTLSPVAERLTGLVAELALGMATRVNAWRGNSH